MTSSKSVGSLTKDVKTIKQTTSDLFKIKRKETKDGKIQKDNEMTELVTSYFGSVFPSKIL